MHKIAIGLTAVLLIMPITAPGIAAEMNTIEVAETAQLCNYCQDYTDAAMAAGPIRTAYQVGFGYREHVAKLFEAREPGARTHSPQ
jgi:hypothetical protein